MLKKLFLLFVLLLLCNTGYSQEKQRYQKMIDSILTELTGVKIDSLKVQAFLKLSRLSKFVDNKADAESYAGQALALAKQTDSYSGKASSYVVFADIYRFNDEQKEREYLFLALKEAQLANKWKGIAFVSRFLGLNYQSTDFKTAEKYLLHSTSLYLQHNKYKEYTEAALELAYLYSEKNEFVKATDLCNTIIDVAGKNKLEAQATQANALLLKVYASLGNTDKTLEHTLDLLKKVESGKFPFLNKCSLYSTLADLYTTKKNLKKAKEFTEKLKNCKDVGLDETDNTMATASAYTKEGNKTLALTTYDKAAEAAFKDKRNYILTTIAQNCFELKDYIRALKYHRQALLLAKEHNVPEPVAASEANVGATCVTLFKQNRDKTLLHEGIALLEKSMVFYKKSRDYNMLSMAALYLSEGYELAGKDKQALSVYKDYTSYNDSVLGRANREALITKQAEFEYGQKEATLKAGQKAALEHQQTQRNYAYAGVGLFVFISISAGVAYSRKRKDNRIIAAEKKRSDDLLLNILPAEVAEELKTKGEAGAKYYDHVSILFTDFIGFTKLSEKFSPEELIGELNYCFKAFDEIITRHNIEKIKTIGDSYMAVSGLPAGNKDHATNAVHAAIEMRNFIENYKAERSAQGRVYFEMRTGINSGEVVAGIVGIKKFAYDVWGDAVNIASRMESNGVGGKINISQSTYELIKDDFETEYRGELEAKGKGHIKMYFVEPKTNGWI